MNKKKANRKLPKQVADKTQTLESQKLVIVIAAESLDTALLKPF